MNTVSTEGQVRAHTGDFMGIRHIISSF